MPMMKATKTGATSANLSAVATESGHFAGREFSSADDYIFMTARGAAGPGNSTTWRAINTTHHVTRMVTDVGKVREVRFEKRVVQDLRVQQPLFTEEAPLQR